MQPRLSEGARSLWQEVEALLSAERLRPYRFHTDSDECDALARYLWNIALCEALYPSLQSLEVALRNAIHNALTSVRQTPFWFDDPGLGLGEFQRSEVDAAKQTLARHHKPVEPGRVVAELGFGFWTSLLGRPYAQSIVIPILPVAFRSMPRHLRSRHTLAVRCDNVRNLRNRVFHHEPIWHYSDLNLQHAEIMQAIGWVSPSTQMLGSSMDRFCQVYRLGSAYYRAGIESRILGSDADEG